MILPAIPDMVTTTQIQRQPSILYSLKDDEYKIVLKGGKKISIISSVPLFQQLTRRHYRVFPSGKRPPAKANLPEELRNVWKGVDPVAYQRELRNE